MNRICSHCHLEYDEKYLNKVIINSKEEWFCCNGCENVFKLLLESNLCDFYDYLGNNKLSTPKIYNNDLHIFDNEQFINKYIKQISNNINEVSLIIENIHCVACIWLNNKILNKLNGVSSVDINYTSNKAKVIYDTNIIKLSDIIRAIQSIGYDAKIYDPTIVENINNKQKQNYYIRVIIALFCTMNIMWIAIAQYLGYFFGMDIVMKNALNISSFILSTPVLFYCGFIFFKSGYYGIKNGIINMDLLVSIGSSITYIYSIYASITHYGETYFESVSMIITFILIGKFLEIKSIKSAGDKIDSLTSLIPQNINVIRNNKSLLLSPEEVKVGDIIEVFAGDKIAIDGILLSDIALLDSSMISGESRALEIKNGDILLSGSINLDYAIKYKATKTFDKSMVNTIINIIQDSMNKKPNIENKANAISYKFSFFIFFIAFITFLCWFFVSSNLEKSIITSISVIIIACPCALALATPIATIVGISEAYKNKLLFKQTKYLETMAKSNAIIFDKTGTITYGVPKVIKVNIIEEFDKMLLASFVRLSNHPVSLGVSKYLSNNINININNFIQVGNKGIKAEYNGDILLGGSRKFLCENGIIIDEHLDSNMLFYYAINKNLKAIFSLSDSVREDSIDVIKAFIDANFRVLIISGDRFSVVEKIAKCLNIKEFYCEKDPFDKSNIIKNLRSEGYHTIMVGDGINDAIAMNESDIAISMGKGSDIAINYSDIVLLDDQLISLLKAYKISSKTYKIIKQNISLSIIYNLITIPLAAFGYIIPLFAALSMSFSSIIVVLNSLRIKMK